MYLIYFALIIFAFHKLTYMKRKKTLPYGETTHPVFGFGEFGYELGNQNPFNLHLQEAASCQQCSLRESRS